MKEADIANATSHSGRRSGLKTIGNKGVNVRVLMMLAEHSKMATTQCYIDLRPSFVKVIVEVI